MYKLRRLKTTGIVALSVAMGGTMIACSNSEPAATDDTAEQTTEATAENAAEDKKDAADDGQEAAAEVAATVNGTEVPEEKVTAYVADFRESQGFDDDAAWAAWMSDFGYTPETVREDVINYYVKEILLNQAAEEYGVEVTQDEIDERVQEVRSQFESDSDWEAALKDAGFTEEEYADTVIKPSAIQEKLTETLGDELEAGEASDDDVVAMAQSYESLFDGARRSSHILFTVDQDADEDAAAAVEAQAQEVLDQINAGDITFEEAVAEYSQDAGSAVQDGDVGWDAFSTFVTEYQDALDGLEVDEVSELVKSDYGYHIIKCTDMYEVPADGIDSIDDIPEDFQEQLRAQLEYMAGDSFTTWFDEYEQKADIVINPMPEGLPYDIDMSAYETTTQEEESLLQDATVSTEEAAVDENTAANEAAEGNESEAATAENAADANAADAAADEQAAEDEAATADDTAVEKDAAASDKDTASDTAAEDEADTASSSASKN